MQYEEYTERFLEHARVSEVRPFAHIVEGARRFPLLRATTPGRNTLLITAGFHGDEKAGPLTLLEHLPEIVEYARKRDVALQVYPCINPSGFEDHTRYNRSGESPNNDFLRYEVAGGVWVGELAAGQSFVSHSPNMDGPKETRALAAELAGVPTPKGALDIHQDPYLADPLSYAYTFGDNGLYRPLVAAMDPLVPVARRFEVDDDVFTDEDGLIQLHDGSVTDYFWRRGVPFTVALETTTSTPMDVCHQVNLIWIRGLIDLCASGS